MTYSPDELKNIWHDLKGEDKMSYENDDWNNGDEGGTYEMIDGQWHHTPFPKRDNYLESLDQWAKDTSDTELLKEYERLSDELDNSREQLDKARQELWEWEMSLKVSEEYNVQIVTEIMNRGLFGEDAPEGPERYFAGTDLW
jgi:hypothetical protein